jgi:hypothetical protein
MTEMNRSVRLMWRKSTASVTGECVEVAFDGQRILVRDSKDRSGPVLAFSSHDWSRFLIALRA